MPKAFVVLKGEATPDELMAYVAERVAPLPSFGAGAIVQDMIAIEKVRHYGETVAAVIAEDRYIAERIARRRWRGRAFWAKVPGDVADRCASRRSRH